MENNTFEKTTRYNSSRFFGEEWSNVRNLFLNEWVPAQQAAANAGLAPKILKHRAADQRLYLLMERVSGPTILEVVRSWRDSSEVDDPEIVRRLTELLAQGRQTLRSIATATHGLHPDWVARNVVLRPDGRWCAVDWENWFSTPEWGDQELDDEMGAFASDLSCSFERRPNVRRFLRSPTAARLADAPRDNDVKL